MRNRAMTGNPHWQLRDILQQVLRSKPVIETRPHNSPTQFLESRNVLQSEA